MFPFITTFLNLTLVLPIKPFLVQNTFRHYWFALPNKWWWREEKRISQREKIHSWFIQWFIRHTKQGFMSCIPRVVGVNPIKHLVKVRFGKDNDFGEIFPLFPLFICQNFNVFVLCFCQKLAFSLFEVLSNPDNFKIQGSALFSLHNTRLQNEMQVAPSCYTCRKFKNRTGIRY